MTNFPSRPSLQISKDMYEDKYLQSGESFEQGMYRIAAAIADDEPHRQELKDILLNRRFLPAGRVQSAVGSARQTTPFNCFVSGTIEDSMDSIMSMLTEAAETMRMGGGIGYNFSHLRPEFDTIRSLQSHSSGPLSFMDVYNALCGTISSSGHRRGAQMGVMNVSHPDIMKFVNAKGDNTTLTNFNISVGISDKFMVAVKEGKGFDLTFEGKVHDTVDANALWDAIMRMTWDYAEPGVLFLDTINKKNNLWYMEDIEATNPCGEQPLPPYGACLLGSFNMVAYLIEIDGKVLVNVAQLTKDIECMVRAMDNVIDIASYPLPQQAEEARTKRRMGLGVTGLANFLEVQGLPYGSPEANEEVSNLLAFIKEQAYGASISNAQVKGQFEALDAEQFIKSTFMQTMPDEIIKGVQKYGIRNSHLTSIAPTGTISLAAENISAGLEPVYAHEQDRVVRRASGAVETYSNLKDYAYGSLGVVGKTSEEVTAAEHVGVLVTASQHVDSACSKTCNVGDSVTYDQFKDIYIKAYDGGASGCTTFRPSGKRFGIITKSEKADTEGASCTIDPNTGERSCSD